MEYETMQMLGSKKKGMRKKAVLSKVELNQTIETIAYMMLRIRALEKENTMLSVSGHGMSAEHATY